MSGALVPEHTRATSLGTISLDKHKNDTEETEDPFTSTILQLDLPHLAFISGLLPTGPGNLQSKNPEMWPLSHLYRLHSELISLSIFCDSEGAKIHDLLQSGMETISKSLHNAEDLEPLVLNHPKPVSRRTSREPKFDPHIRPTSPGFYGSQIPRVKSENNLRTRVTNSTPRIPRQSPRHHLTPDALWDNVNLLMKPVDDLTSIRKYLTETTVTSSPELLAEPMGPHYSKTLVTSDPQKSKLIVPPPHDLKGNTNANSQLHSRLIAAMVPLLGFTEEKSRSNEAIPVNAELLRDLKRAENVSATPVAETGGFSVYERLDFGEKLALEVKYAGMERSGGPLNNDACPIMQDMVEAIEREPGVVDEANKWRRAALEILEKKKDILDKRASRYKRWQEEMHQHVLQERARMHQEKKYRYTASTESE